MSCLLTICNGLALSANVYDFSDNDYRQSMGTKYF